MRKRGINALDREKELAQWVDIFRKEKEFKGGRHLERMGIEALRICLEADYATNGAKIEKAKICLQALAMVREEVNKKQPGGEES